MNMFKNCDSYFAYRMLIKILLIMIWCSFGGYFDMLRVHIYFIYVLLIIGVLQQSEKIARTLGFLNRIMCLNERAN